MRRGSPAAKSSLMAASSRAGSMEKPVLWQVGSTRTCGVTATMHALRTELCACTISQERCQQPPGKPWGAGQRCCSAELLVAAWCCRARPLEGRHQGCNSGV